MNNISGKITMSRDSNNNVSIRIVDEAANTEFLVINMTTEAFGEAITGMGRTPCLIEPQNLERVGKTRKSKAISFPSKAYDRNNAIEQEKERVRDINQECGLDGDDRWVASGYFGSVTSFTTENGIEVAHSTIHRWV